MVFNSSFKHTITRWCQAPTPGAKWHVTLNDASNPRQFFNFHSQTQQTKNDKRYIEVATSFRRFQPLLENMVVELFLLSCGFQWMLRLLAWPPAWLAGWLTAYCCSKSQVGVKQFSYIILVLPLSVQCFFFNISTMFGVCWWDVPFQVPLLHAAGSQIYSNYKQTYLGSDLCSIVIVAFCCYCGLCLYLTIEIQNQIYWKQNFSGNWSEKCHVFMIYAHK